MTDFFISDTHFDHYNIINFAKRPFTTTDEMNEALIQNWNRRVGKQDTVYHIGDVGFFRSAQRMQDVMSHLNGRKILILGNHDKFTKTQYRMAGFEEIHKHIIYPYPPWPDATIRDHFTVIHKPLVLSSPNIVLCGHIHQQWYVWGNNLNMSVEVWGYQPATLEEINFRISWLRENVYDTNTYSKLFAKNSAFDVGIHPPIPGE